MLQKTCKRCGLRGLIYYGGYYCPRCRTHTPEGGWAPASFSPREDSSALLPPRRPRPPSPSRRQNVFACPDCGHRIPPWAVMCPRCRWLIE